MISSGGPDLSHTSPAPRAFGQRGRGFLAVCAGFVVTGLGHVIVGRPRRGLVWFLGSAAMTAAMFAAICLPKFQPTVIILFPLCVLWSLCALVDAYRCGSRSTSVLLRSAMFRYLTGAAIIIIVISSRKALKPEVAIAMYVRDHFAETFVITTNTMGPTLVIHDRILCNKNVPVSRWSVAVVNSPMTPGLRLVKRIVGLPGETVQIIGGRVSVNGAALTSPAGVPRYTTLLADGMPIHGPACDNPIVLGPDEYYCLGDNTLTSADSRYWPAIGQHQRGAIPACSIVGTATYIYWPPNRWKRLY